VTYAVIKIRSIAKTKPDARRTLELLNLDRTNHCVLVKDDVHYNGMLQKVKDYVALKMGFVVRQYTTHQRLRQR
jgi:large subunit ribosomal protein L30